VEDIDEKKVKFLSKATPFRYGFTFISVIMKGLLFQFYRMGDGLSDLLRFRSRRTMVESYFSDMRETLVLVRLEIELANSRFSSYIMFCRLT